MKKISLKTFRKSLSLGKSKEDAELMVVQQPTLASNFRKKESLFGRCYGKEMAGCDLQGEDEMGKNPSKSESLLGTLKRLLSTKQKAKGRGGMALGSSVDKDKFSLSPAPPVFKDVRSPKPMHSPSLCSHHYSPMPWPLRPTSSEEMCIRMEWQVKARVHSPDPGRPSTACTRNSETSARLIPHGRSCWTRWELRVPVRGPVPLPG